MGAVFSNLYDTHENSTQILKNTHHRAGNEGNSNIHVVLLATNTIVILIPNYTSYVYDFENNIKREIGPLDIFKIHSVALDDTNKILYILGSNEMGFSTIFQWFLRSIVAPFDKKISYFPTNSFYLGKPVCGHLFVHDSDVFISTNRNISKLDKKTAKLQSILNFEYILSGRSQDFIISPEKTKEGHTVLMSCINPTSLAPQFFFPTLGYYNHQKNELQARVFDITKRWMADYFYHFKEICFTKNNEFILCFNSSAVDSINSNEYAQGHLVYDVASNDCYKQIYDRRIPNHGIKVLPREQMPSPAQRQKLTKSIENATTVSKDIASIIQSFAITGTIHIFVMRETESDESIRNIHKHLKIPTWELLKDTECILTNTFMEKAVNPRSF